MLPKTDPLPRYEVTIRRDRDRFTKLALVELASRQRFFTLGLRDDFPARMFYYEVWSKPPWWQLWKSPTILFRGTCHDPLGLTYEYPADVEHHVADAGPPGEYIEGTEADFERDDGPRDSTTMFLMIVPWFDGDTTLRLFSRDFTRAFAQAEGTAAAVIDLP